MRTHRAYKVALIPIGFIVAFLLTLLADRALMACLVVLPHHLNLLFPELSRASYRTSEFAFTSTINSFGIRDHEYSLAKRARYRIVAIGDSLTYGWGVELDDSWVKLVEARLSSRHYDVELLNLGIPGAYPPVYADIAERAVPLLKPDIVLLAVPQGDDFTQSLVIHRQDAIASGQATSKEAPTPFLARLFPHFFYFREQMRAPQQVQDTWARQAAELTAHLSEEQEQRFRQIAPSIQEMFRSGNLNPAMLSYVLNWPNYFLMATEISGPTAQRAIADMCQEFKRIYDIAASIGARALIVSVPFRAHVCSADLPDMALLGLPIPTSIVSADLDTPIREAAACAEVPFHEVTTSFRNRCASEPLYYRFDGHLNRAGNRLFAEDLLPILEGVLRSSSEHKKTTGAPQPSSG
jgi:lysophospholipase L1-like esterase